MAEKFLPLSPYNYALNNPLNVIDPDGMEARPLDGSVTFHGYAGDDGNGNFIDSTAKGGNNERAPTKSEIAREKGNLLYNHFKAEALAFRWLFQFNKYHFYVPDQPHLRGGYRLVSHR